MTPDRLKEQVNKLPAKPGVYFFQNSKNKPLYIGKALNLKNRIKHYLKTSDLRLSKMISEASKIDFRETDSEIEALILESQYIKKQRPAFNIMLRDDKQYSYVGFTHSTSSGQAEEYPKIFITHQPFDSAERRRRVVLSLSKDNRSASLRASPAEFIGPFTDAGAIKTTLRLLRRIFPYCTCKQLHHNYCLNYHMGKCPGYCCLKDSPKQLVVSTVEPSQRIAEKKLEYQKNIKAIKSILSGKSKSLIKKFEQEMKNLANKQKYEKALELQTKLEKLKRIYKNAQIIQRGSNIMIYHNVKAIEQLQSLLNLPLPPHRIEAYDVANIQGEYATGAMVVFTLQQTSGQAEWKPDKNEYRKFKIYTKQTPNDTAMLKEILIRRFNHTEWPYPDLVIIDGGIAQLNAARKVIFNLKFKIFNEFSIKQLPKIIALTKNEKHIGHKIILNNKKEMLLSKLPSEVKNLLLHIDSEAHRFAISYYRKLHGRSVK